MFLIGNALIILALMFTPIMPINKKLWTTSFTLFMAGLDFVIFAGLLWIVDGQKVRRWATPFAILGMNSIFVYMLSEIGETLTNTLHIGGQSVRDWVYQHLFAGWMNDANAGLLYSLSYVALMFAAALVLYRRGRFVRV